jgi:NADPH:quinone reductase-like Zn-dependent oxidoreductase
VVTTCSTAKVDFCKALGADECLDYTTQKLSALQAGGKKFDLIFDTVGNAKELGQANLSTCVCFFL